MVESAEDWHRLNEPYLLRPSLRVELIKLAANALAAPTRPRGNTLETDGAPKSGLVARDRCQLAL